MIEEFIVLGKIIVATLLYLLVFQIIIKLHDCLMIKRIRREARNER